MDRSLPFEHVPEGQDADVTPPFSPASLARALLIDPAREAFQLAGNMRQGNASPRDVGRFGLLSGLGSAGNALPFSRAEAMALKGRSPHAPIPGTPRTVKLPGGEEIEVKPLPGIVRAEETYRQRKGTERPPKEFAPFDPEAAKGYAQAYEEMPHAPGDPEVERAYWALAHETRDQFEHLRDEGYRFSFMKEGPDGKVVDPYAGNPALVYKDLRDNKHMAVLPSRSAYGPEEIANYPWEINENPMLRSSGVTFEDGKNALTNDLFRAVHDTFGHGRNPFFRAPGEERAYQLHSAMFSPLARRALAAETRGQNSWVNYGPHGEANRGASGADTVFAEQKLGVMPKWATEGGRPPPMDPHVPMPQAAPNMAPFTLAPGEELY